MHQKIVDNLRMTDIEASEHYPDSFIIMCMDGMDSPMGTVLYVGDNQNEIISLVMEQREPFCGVIEGLNHRRSMGGVVIGG